MCVLEDYRVENCRGVRTEHKIKETVDSGGLLEHWVSTCGHCGEDNSGVFQEVCSVIVNGSFEALDRLGFHTAKRSTDRAIYSPPPRRTTLVISLIPTNPLRP